MLVHTPSPREDSEMTLQDCRKWRSGSKVVALISVCEHHMLSERVHVWARRKGRFQSDILKAKTEQHAHLIRRNVTLRFAEYIYSTSQSIQCGLEGSDVFVKRHIASRQHLFCHHGVHNLLGRGLLRPPFHCHQATQSRCHVANR